jgi:hypothetical protein
VVLLSEAPFSEKAFRQRTAVAPFVHLCDTTAPTASKRPNEKHKKKTKKKKNNNNNNKKKRNAEEKEKKEKEKVEKEDEAKEKGKQNVEEKEEGKESRTRGCCYLMLSYSDHSTASELLRFVDGLPLTANQLHIHSAGHGLEPEYLARPTASRSVHSLCSTLFRSVGSD